MVTVTIHCCTGRCCKEKTEEEEALAGKGKKCCPISRRAKCCLIIGGVLVVAGAVTGTVLALTGGSNDGGGGSGPTPPPTCTPGEVFQLMGAADDAMGSQMVTADHFSKDSGLATPLVTLFQAAATSAVGALGAAASKISLAWNASAVEPFAAARIGELAQDCSFTSATGSNVALTINADLAGSEQILAAYQQQRFHLRGLGSSVQGLKKETRQRLIDAHMREGMTQNEAEQATKAGMQSAMKSVETGIEAGHDEMVLEMTVAGRTIRSGEGSRSFFFETLTECIEAIQEATVEAVCYAKRCAARTGSLSAHVSFTPVSGGTSNLDSSAAVAIAPGS